MVGERGRGGGERGEKKKTRVNGGGPATGAAASCCSAQHPAARGSVNQPAGEFRDCVAPTSSPTIIIIIGIQAAALYTTYIEPN